MDGFRKREGARGVRQGGRAVRAAVTLFALAALVACRGGDAPEQPPGGPTAAPAAGALTLMAWPASPAENARLQQLVDQFNRDNPATPVTLDLPADFDAALQARLEAGDPPDVFTLTSFAFPDVAQAGALAPVGDSVTDPADIHPAVRDAFSADGALACAPRDVTTLALFYNPDMFAAKSLAPPTADWTWESLRAAAEPLSDLEQGIYGLAFSPDMARWLPFLYQAGGSVTNAAGTAMTLAGPQAQQALGFYVGLVMDGFAQEPSSLDVSWNGDAFARGRAAMTVEGLWLAPYLDEQFPDHPYGVAPLPAGPAGRATLAFASCYAVAAAAPNPAAARRLVQFLSAPEAMQAWTNLGRALPARVSLRAGWEQRFPALQPFSAGLDEARVWQFPPGFAPLVDLFNRDLTAAFSDEMSVEAVLQETEAAGAAILAGGP